ncbi:hypothetical protein BOTBODRAFT_178123 [Botryobasidium botryosum FD-172 SS1]|uniref:Uncharacterized protein n=1 Tax=Botryobasidium botryosum (strain FD-172 SS1) TaxID=930990 RepID=A0A067MFX0_BOTB1|nr:hypothetical protein BOTBODRAFT_178123 [Botryobasidium botryosum FD-172 SS1]
MSQPPEAHQLFDPLPSAADIKKQLAQALSEHDNNPVFCSGIWKASPADLVLFYGEDDGARRIKFPSTAAAQLEALADACAKATFGHEHEDVLDESYRKAGKMDVEQFALKFDVNSSGLLEHVRRSLFPMDSKLRPVRAELYKRTLESPRKCYMLDLLILGKKFRCLMLESLKMVQFWAEV